MTPGQAAGMAMSAMRSLAAADPAQLAAGQAGDLLKMLEKLRSVETAVRARLGEIFETRQGPGEDGYRALTGWLVHRTRVTRAQASTDVKWLRRLRAHPEVRAAMADGGDLTQSHAEKICGWSGRVLPEYRADVENILVGASLAGAGVPELSRAAAELIARLGEPDTSTGDDLADRGLRLHTTFDGAGVLHGDLTPACTAVAAAVIGAFSARAGGDDDRTISQRNHDALEHALKLLLSSKLMPSRGGSPVTALVHIRVGDLVLRDEGSALMRGWAADCNARLAGDRARAAASGGGDGGTWVTGTAALGVACDALIIPVVTGQPNLDAARTLISLCIEYQHLSDQLAEESAAAAAAAGSHGTRSPDDTADSTSADDTSADSTSGDDASSDISSATAGSAGTGSAGAGSAELEELMLQIVRQACELLSGPGGLLSHLRRNLFEGTGVGGPSVILDVGRSDHIPAWMRKTVSARDQHCQWPGGCEAPATECDPHHVEHKANGGHTSTWNIYRWCKWHHHIIVHRYGWIIRVLGDGRLEATSPDGTRVFRTPRPPPARPG
jgi:hypothetical protein